MYEDVQGTENNFEAHQGVVALRDLGQADLLGARGQGEGGLVDGKPGVLAGTYGVVVDVIESSGSLAVEFFDSQGRTIDIAYIRPDAVRPATREEREQAGRLTTQSGAS